MSDFAQGPGWWQASDGRWYPPESHPSVQLPPPPAPGSYGQEPSRHQRRRTVLVSITGTLIVVLVIVVVVVALVPTGGSNLTVATFVPLRSSASTQQLGDDAHQLTRRLDSFGDPADSVVVRGRTIVVLGAARLPVPPPTLVEAGDLQFRPALCESDPYGPSRTGATPGPVPGACSTSQYSLMAPNLIVNVPTGNSNIETIPPDPALTHYQTSSSVDNDDHPDAPVLIPLVGGGGERYLLGPSQLNGSIVVVAQAADQASQWVVNVTLTDAGATAWDTMAQRYFHEIIGIDLDGRVISAPLTEPSQATYTSFDGKVQISGSFSKRSAQALAADLDSGPLATPLRVRP